MSRWKPALVGIAAAVLLFAYGVLTVLIPDDEPAAPPTTITTKVDTLDGSPDKDKAIEVPAAAVEAAADGLAGETATGDGIDHTDARDETPAAASPLDLEENAEALQENRETTQALPTAGASGGAPGCRTQFVANQSSRRGVKPTIQVLHYTVSPNRPGWSDVDGITAFFNRSSSQASSNFVIDAEGNCAYIVPIEAKAWTQAGGNPWAVSYEIIATGREPDYLGSAGYAKLRSVMRWVSQVAGIPMRAGAISGCAPSRSGIVQHADGGTCWGGHHDIGPFSFSAVLAKVTAGGVTGTDRVTCRRLNSWRNAGRPRGGAWERNSVRRKAALTKRGVTCATKGPVKA